MVMVMTVAVLVLVGGLLDYRGLGGAVYKPRIDNEEAGIKQFH